MTFNTVMGLARLARLVYNGADTRPLTEGLLARLNADSADASAWMDLSILAYLHHQPDVAHKAQAEALSLQRGYTLQPVHPSRLTVLALMAPGELMANTPLEFLLEKSDITLHLYYMESADALNADLPTHDVLFVAIGESDRNRNLLEALVEPLQHWPKPVINRPAHIIATGRDRACHLLNDIPGLVVPPVNRLDRVALAALLDNLKSPCIVRPVDSHAGKGLSKITTADEGAAYLAATDATLFYQTPYIDYADKDGWFRKCRVVLLDGRAYAGHLAISRHWMVHYLNAGMTDSAAKRGEEAHFMANFSDGFVTHHADVLTEIYARTQLDYVTLDCAELSDGRLLLFEIDTSAVSHDMDAHGDFAYKQTHMAVLFTAFTNFLMQRAGEV